MARRSVSRFQRTVVAGPRRQVSWSVGPEGSITGLAGAAVNVFPTAVELTIDGATIVRSRIDLTLGLTTVTAAGDGFARLAFGMCVVTQNAAGVGVTALPDPLVDVNWDGWFVHWQGALWSTAAGGVSADDGIAAQRLSLDSKAMRKIHATDVVVAMFTNSTEVGAAVMTARLISRILFKHE